MTDKKNTINKIHPRIKNRPEYLQKYRDNLSENFKKTKSLGPMGKKTTEKELSKASDYEYIFDRYGYTKLAAKKLFDCGKGEYVARNIHKFNDLDHKEVAQKLFDCGKGEYIARNLEKFEGLDHKEVAKKLFDHGKGEYVARNIHKFNDLDEETIQKVIEMGYRAEAEKYLLKDKK